MEEENYQDKIIILNTYEPIAGAPNFTKQIQ
jgi:hypothetical protein